MDLEPETAQPRRLIDKRFRWAIAGAGAIARQFADDLAHAGGAELVAVLSRDEAKGRAFAPGSRARVFTSLDTMLEDAAFDALYIATPNHLHREQALKAIVAGKPVLVEKPIATSVADARAIFDAAQKHGVFAMEAMWSRFLPAIQAAKKVIDAGQIGKVERIVADLSYAKPFDPGSRFYDKALGGGAALDLGVYPLSLAMALLGPPRATTGKWLAAGSGVDMRSSFELEFDGAVAQLSCGFDCDGPNFMAVIGSDGALRLAAPFLKAQRMTIFDRKHRDAALDVPLGVLGKIAVRLPSRGSSHADYSFHGNGLQFEIQEVQRRVSAGERVSPIMPPQHSIAVLEAIETVLSRSAG